MVPCIAARRAAPTLLFSQLLTLYKFNNSLYSLGGGYCKLSVSCSKQCAWDNATCTCSLPPPGCVPQAPGIATFAKPIEQQQHGRTVWNRRTGQYETEPRRRAAAAATIPVSLAAVRELASLSSPWYFRAIPKQNASAYASSWNTGQSRFRSSEPMSCFYCIRNSDMCLLACWNTAFDPEGLAGDYGLRTAERRHPQYFCDKPRPGPGGGCCR